MFVGCSSKSGTTSQTPEVFAKSLPLGTTTIDTILCFRKDPEFPTERNHIFFGTDTIYRFGPYYFGSKKCILLAKLHNSVIEEHSLVFTDYSRSPRPITSISGVKIDSTGYIQIPWDRGISNRQEYIEIADSLIKEHGTPSSKTDTSVSWKERGVYLTGYNSFSTVILTFSKLAQGPNIKHDWQFCAVITADSAMLSFKRGVPESEMNLSLRDTVPNGAAVSDTFSFKYKPYRMFGLPGMLYCHVNKANNITGYFWNPKSTGIYNYQDVFTSISDGLITQIKPRYPVYNKYEDDIIILYSWTDGKDAIYSLYEKEVFQMTVGLIPSDGINRMIPVLVSDE